MKKLIYSVLFLAALGTIFTGCKDDESNPQSPKSSEKKITTFDFEGLDPDVTGVIDESDKSVLLTVPYGTGVEALVPTINVSEGASISPASGVAQDFSTPVTYTVTAADGSMQEYEVTVLVALGEITCLPTQLPGEEAYLHITYNEDHTIQQVDYQNYDDPEPGRFISTFHYDNGKLSRIESFEDDVKNFYTEFEYDVSTITETIYERDAENDIFEKVYYYIHYLENGRITSTGSFDGSENFVMTELVEYTYDEAGNITHLDEYNSVLQKQATWDIEYDNHVNPYKAAGISGGDGSFFDFENLSNNNYVKGTYTSPPGGDVSEDEVTYTYDTDGNPLTRKFDWDEDTRSFVYACE